jgi:hypothetical protein
MRKGRKAYWKWTIAIVIHTSFVEYVACNKILHISNFETFNNKIKTTQKQKKY